MKQKYVVWFSEVGKEDIALVGGKGANLGEMTKAGFPVPKGFIVTSLAYEDFLEMNSLKLVIDTYLRNIDINNDATLNEISKKIRHSIAQAYVPKNIAQEIIRAYFRFDRSIASHAFVAVRSSATAEDLPGASFAGQQETFLNVRGEANLIEKIRLCWSSLFTPRAIFYRVTNHFDHFKVGIAVPVQLMIESEKSGILFTIDPVVNNKEKIVIEAVYGLGELIVQGKVTPDHYEVDKKSLTILSKITHVQDKRMKRERGKNIIEHLSVEKGGKMKLTDDEIIKLAQLGKKLEQHYYFPQDAEWAIEKGKIYIVQTRPVTTTGKKIQSKAMYESFSKEILLQGDPASPGIATGIVCVLESSRQLQKIKHGDILVAPQTNPDYVPAMKRAVAIITERGGRTSHAAIVSRELGIPAIVGVKDACTRLKDGMTITVNGVNGEIIKGSLSPQEIKKYTVEIKPKENYKTATKVYVNISEADRAQVIAKKHVDGIGLLRAEFMIAGIGIHPKKLIEEKKSDIFIRSLSKQLESICSAFSPRPVIYRATDFKTNEYRNLKGGKAYEPEEPNPMLGFRGAARYIADPNVFNLELSAIKYVRNKMGLKNLWLMIPFVRTPKELLEVKKLIASCGLSRSQQFKLFLMVEIPTNIIRLDEFIDVGIDGISIGSNDLTMLMLGTDRDNSEVAHDFSERDESVLWALERAIRIAGKRGITSSICGQAPSDYPDLVDKLVSWGISSISVNPDAIDHVRETIYHAERTLVIRK